MMQRLVLLLVAVALIGLTARISLAKETFVLNYLDIVEAADWTTMKTVTVDIDTHTYTPDTLTFKAGQPYRLVFKNRSKKEKHYFTAPEFYRAIATRKVHARGLGDIRAPYFTALEIMRNGGQLELYFVPVTKGTFEAYCTLTNHRERGMDAKIVIR